MNKDQKELFRKLRAKERMSASTFWSELVVSLISYLCAVIVMVIIVSVALPLETQQLSHITNWLAIIMAVLWCIPIARNTRLRLRDAGFSAKAYLWLLLPIVGWIIFIALLCAKGLPRKASEV